MLVNRACVEKTPELAFRKVLTLHATRKKGKSETVWLEVEKNALVQQAVQDMIPLSLETRPSGYGTGFLTTVS